MNYAKRQRISRIRTAIQNSRRTVWLTFEELEPLVVSTDLTAKDVARVLDVSTKTLRRSTEIYSVIYNGQPVSMYDLLRSRVQKRKRKANDKYSD